MTAAEFKEAFLIKYDRLANLAAPGYDDNEISFILTQAQEQLVKSHYNFKSNKFKDGFEETEKRRKDLSELTRNANLDSSAISLDQDGVSQNGIFYNLPDDLLYTIREEATLASDDTCVNGDRVGVRPVTHDEYVANINNPFKKPGTSRVWRLDFSTGNNTNRRHELITNGSYTIDTYHVRYIKRPIAINIPLNITSELDESVHSEIVDRAVRIATGITDFQQYQIKTMEQSMTE
jgi:hypothetical protein